GCELGLGAGLEGDLVNGDLLAPRHGGEHRDPFPVLISRSEAGESVDGHVPGVLPLSRRNLHPEVLSHLPLGGFRDYLPGDLPGLGAEEQLFTLFSVLSHHPYYALPTTKRGT